jgi:hypothetical protein
MVERLKGATWSRLGGWFVGVFEARRGQDDPDFIAFLIAKR